MKFGLNGQTLCFLYAIILGLVYGLGWDVNNKIRGRKKLAVRGVICDLLFCILVTISFFIFVLTFGMGSIRGYIVVGGLIGSLLYFLSLRWIFTGIFNGLENMFGKIRVFRVKICKFIEKFKIIN